MKRSELLEMLIAQIEENQRLQKTLDVAKAELEKRHIILENAGSIAEAALKLNGVFEAAQNAAQQYIESVKLLSEQKQSEKDQACSQKGRI